MKTLIIFLFISITVIANGIDSLKVVTAYKLLNPLKLDGDLREDVYKNKPVKGFTQRNPDEGKPAQKKTNVWVSYDDNYFYVSAFMFDSSPDSIDVNLERRDNLFPSDWIGFHIDTFNDDRTAFFFGISAGGVVVDGTFYNDESSDTDWNGIWEANTAIQSNGWSAEFKVPFSQLRFNDEDELTWGINFIRVIKRINEESYYIAVPKEESGFVSHFAELKGLRGIKSGQRIEVFPYVVQKAQSLVHENGDPFYKGNQFNTTLGADIKVGVGSNLNLDITLNPDFGQVEVDPAVLNLSAFETYFPEKRPFFIEGSNILSFGNGGSNNNWNFNFGTPNLFYSRRIGRSPQGSTSGGDYVDFPGETRILGAGKITGKVNENFSIGAVSALTQRTFATVADGPKRIKEEVEPFTHYGVVRLLKEFNNGKQALGVILTSVNRNLESDELKNDLAKEAYTAGIDGWTFLDNDENYVVNATIIGSYVSGSKTFTNTLQKSPYRYLQRPDATYMKLDPNKTNLSGAFGRISINKQKGNFYFNASLGAVTPGFEYNDLGFQWSANKINTHLVLGYKWFETDKYTRDKWFFLAHFRTYDFDGNNLSNGIMAFSNINFINYYSLHTNFRYSFGGISTGLTRGGPMVKYPNSYGASININSDDRENIVFGVGVNYNGDDDGSNSKSIDFDIEWKPLPQLSISMGPEFRFGLSQHQWIDSFNDEYAINTYGKRYVFGELHQKTISGNIRLNWLFTPDLSLQIYAQPYFTIGDYRDLNELARAGYGEYNYFGKGNSTITYDSESEIYTVDPDGGKNPADSFTFNNPNFNFKSLLANVVLRWEITPGSIVFLVWNHNQKNFDNPGELNFNRDFKNLWSEKGDDIFIAKFTYWFDV